MNPLLHSRPIESMCVFLRCAERGDLESMQEMVTHGLDLASANCYGESVLTQLIDHLQVQPREQVLAMVKQVVHLGANPRQLDLNGDEIFSPLVEAMLYMDANLMKFLLEAGANPNALRERGRPLSLYSWAWSDYQMEEWGVNNVPEEPTVEEQFSEEGWLFFFNRLAVKHGKRRPTHIALLRQHGAMTSQEMREAGLE